MDIELLRSFLMWCTIINGGLLALWTLVFLAAPDLVFRSQKKWFHQSQETFNLVFYCFIGLFKLLFLIFNLVPFVALMLASG